MKKIGFQISSLLHVEQKELWEDVWNMNKINEELAPWVRMKLPNLNFEGILISEIPLEQPLFSSWVFLLGFIPVDIHHFGFKSIDPGNRFEEYSSTVLLNRWEHTRTLVAQNDGKTLLTDKIRFQHKVPLLEKLTLPIYRAVFRHRHSYLKRKYNHHEQTSKTIISEHQR